MKRYKAFASCCMACACMAAMLVVLTGCGSQQNYTPPEKTPTLSAPAIGKDGTLRVGVNTENQPLAGMSSSSKIVGIDTDVAAALADSFGLKVEIVDVGADAESALKNGTVDIVMGIDKSETDTAFWKSEAYVSTGVALFAKSASAAVPVNAPDVTIAAQTSSKSAWAVTNEFDQSSISTTNDLKSAFDELASGRVQYVAADALIGTYAAHTTGDEVHVVALMQQASGYCIGVSDANVELKQAVSDALATLIGNGVIGVIETKWLGAPMDVSTAPLTAGAAGVQDATGTATVDTVETEAAEVPAEQSADASIGDGSDVAASPVDAVVDASAVAGDASIAVEPEAESTAGANAVQVEGAAV